MLGPEQGRQLEERLRLDSLSVNADAVAAKPEDPGSSFSPPAKPLLPQEPQQQHHLRRESDGATDTRSSGGGGINPGKKSVTRPTSVPDHRLPEIRDQVCMYSTACAYYATDGGRHVR